MTLADVVTIVMARLNLTSTTASARVLDSVREAYQRVISDLDILSPTRQIITQVVSIGNRNVTFTAVQLLAVYTGSAPLVLMGARDFDQLRNTAIVADPPTEYAVIAATGTTVTIYLNSVPASGFTLTADALVSPTPMGLANTIVPAFPELYHDLLIHGAMATELRKLEKDTLAKTEDDVFQARLVSLRQYLGDRT